MSSYSYRERRFACHGIQVGMLNACQIALVVAVRISTLHVPHPAYTTLERDTQVCTHDPFCQPSLALLLLVPGISQFVLNCRHRERWHLTTGRVALRMPRAETGRPPAPGVQVVSAKDSLHLLHWSQAAPARSLPVPPKVELS